MEFCNVAFYLSRKRGLFHDLLLQHALATVHEKNAQVWLRNLSSVLNVAIDEVAFENDVRNANSLPDKNVVNGFVTATKQLVVSSRYREQCIFESAVRDLVVTYLVFLKAHQTSPSGCLYAASNLGALLDSYHYC